VSVQGGQQPRYLLSFPAVTACPGGSKRRELVSFRITRLETEHRSTLLTNLASPSVALSRILFEGKTTNQFGSGQMRAAASHRVIRRRALNKALMQDTLQSAKDFTLTFLQKFSRSPRYMRRPPLADPGDPY
jgi:hypothetical protein